jgi:hypothetical protein
MKVILLAIFCCVSVITTAQVGRHEQPVDTLPIGGQVQENKQTQMQAQDTLLAQLKAVRDSISGLRAGSEYRSLESTRKELDLIISELERDDQNPGMMKRGYALLNDIRGASRQASKPARK